LLDEGHEEAQGFLYGEPLSADFEKYLRARQFTDEGTARLRRRTRRVASGRRMPR